MTVTSVQPDCTCELAVPKRNNYFYGQLLDVHQFRLETEYHSYKRRLLNRLVLGWGVVCGLDVKRAENGDDSIIVTPGLAIDQHGNEIIVTEQAGPFPVPPDVVARAPQGKGSEDVYVHVILCYHECLCEPTPVLTTDCHGEAPCQPAVVCERSRVDFKPDCAPTPVTSLRILDCISEGKLDYDMLAKVVTEECPPCPPDPCIPLANIRVITSQEQHSCRPDEIDITIRPICYANDLLFQLLLCEITETKYRPLK